MASLPAGTEAGATEQGAGANSHVSQQRMASPAARSSEASCLCLQDRIGYLFQDLSLLERALTHPSSTSEDNRDNERMEFLGDSVVNLCIAQALYESHPHWSEGDLTQVKSAVVSTTGLARAAENLGLRDVGRFGKGLPLHEPLPPSVYANLFEAVAAAVYLDGGLDAARSFVLRVLSPDMRVAAENGGEPNPKSMLQHFAQKNFGQTPHYRMVGSSGPDHDKVFQVSAYVGQRMFLPGTGRSKKEAEQAAAKRALEALDSEAMLSTGACAAPMPAIPPHSAGRPGLMAL
ncbi:MAG TPA: ribonuclease III [Planctomycetota bacterium]|jgi:ribonuclease-3